MADANDLSGLMITAFHFCSMCTYFYGDNTCGLFRFSSALRLLPAWDRWISALQDWKEKDCQLFYATAMCIYAIH